MSNPHMAFSLPAPWVNLVKNQKIKCKMLCNKYVKLMLLFLFFYFFFMTIIYVQSDITIIVQINILALAILENFFIFSSESQ